MTKWRNDFKAPNSHETYYDLFEDWDLIESSFAQQYRIRLRKNLNDMEWGEFSSLLAGLNGDTPLGNIVRIRSEKDPKVLKNFTTQEKKIRNDWLTKNAVQISEENYKQAMEDIKNMFIVMSSSKGDDKK